MFYGIVVTLSILYRAIKKISSNLNKVRGEKGREEKKGSDERMKNTWNYHGICITAGFQARR